MDDLRLAPALGVLASLALLAALALPYLLVDAPSAVGAYYGSGAANPLVAGLFAVVAVVVFAAGRADRTDPALAAGVALALGGFAALLALAWAATVPEDVVVGMSRNTLVGYHRWLLAVVSLGLPGAAGWYARALGVV